MNFDALNKECTVFHQQNMYDVYFCMKVSLLPWSAIYLTSGDMTLLGESGMWKKADTA